MCCTFTPKTARNTSSIVMSFLPNFPLTIYMVSNKTAASESLELTLPSSQIPCPRLCLAHHNLEYRCLIHVIHSFNKYLIVINDMRGAVIGTGDKAKKLTDMFLVLTDLTF